MHAVHVFSRYFVCSWQNLDMFCTKKNVYITFNSKSTRLELRSIASGVPGYFFSGFLEKFDVFCKKISEIFDQFPHFLGKILSVLQNNLASWHHV